MPKGTCLRPPPTTVRRCSGSRRSAGHGWSKNCSRWPRQLRREPARRLSGARRIGATDALLDAIGFALAPFVAAIDNAARARVARDLDSAALAAQQEAGRRLSRAEALAEASAAVEVARDTTTSLPSVHERLTTRELEVLRLLAVGRSNTQIAEALFISPRTVSTHLTSIFTKLDVEGRAEAVAVAQCHGPI